MHIKDSTGSTGIEIGTPSINHVTLSQDKGSLANSKIESVVIHIAEWNELKARVDKMFNIVHNY